MRWMPTRQGWITLGLALAYGASPLDLLPDAVPVVGLLDDVGVVGLLMAWTLWRSRARGSLRSPALEDPLPE